MSPFDLNILYNGSDWHAFNKCETPRVIESRSSLHSLLQNLDLVSDSGKNYFIRLFEPYVDKTNIKKKSSFILVPDQEQGFYRIVVGGGIKRPICFANVIYYHEADQQFKVFGLAEEGKETTLTRRAEVVDDPSTRKREVHYILYEDGVRKGRLFGFQKPTRDGEEEERITIPTKVSRMQVVGINPLLIVALSKLLEKNILFPALLANEEFRNTTWEQINSSLDKKFLFQLKQQANLDGELEEELSQLRMFCCEEAVDIFAEDTSEKERTRHSFLTLFCDLNAREDIPEPVHLDCATVQMCEVVHTRFPQSIRTRTRFERKDGLVLGLLKEALTFFVKDNKPSLEAEEIKKLASKVVEKEKTPKLMYHETLNIMRMFFKSSFSVLNIFRNAFYMAEFATCDYHILREVVSDYLKEGIETVQIITNTPIEKMFCFDFTLNAKTGEVDQKFGAEDSLFKIEMLIFMLKLPMEALMRSLEHGFFIFRTSKPRSEDMTTVDNLMLDLKRMTKEVMCCKDPVKRSGLQDKVQQQTAHIFSEVLRIMIFYLKDSLLGEKDIMKYPFLSEHPGMKDHMHKFKAVLEGKFIYKSPKVEEELEQKVEEKEQSTEVEEKLEPETKVRKVQTEKEKREEENKTTREKLKKVLSDLEKKREKKTKKSKLV